MNTNKILVIVDPQNDFCSEGGSLSTKEAIKATGEIARYVSENKFDEIYVTADTHRDDYLNTLEGKKLPVPHCVFGKHGWLVNDEINSAVNSFPETKLHFVTKETFGFLNWKKEMGGLKDKEIFIVGFCTDICVAANALILRTVYPNTNISVVANCCAGTSPDKHIAALRVLDSCQIDIV